MAITTPNPMAQEWSSNVVQEIARISPRQLQWWDERDVLSPKRKKSHRRFYLTEEVIGISVIAELRRKRLSLQKMRPLVRLLRREIGRHLGQVWCGKSEWYFLTDGDSAYLEDSPERIIELLKKSPAPMFLVSVSDQANRLRQVRKLPSRKKRSPRSEDQPMLF